MKIYTYDDEAGAIIDAELYGDIPELGINPHVAIFIDNAEDDESANIVLSVAETRKLYETIGSWLDEEIQS